MKFSKTLLTICLLIISSNIKSAQEAKKGQETTVNVISSLAGTPLEGKGATGEYTFTVTGKNVADLKKQLAEEIQKLGINPTEYNMEFKLWYQMLPDNFLTSEIAQMGDPELILEPIEKPLGLGENKITVRLMNVLKYPRYDFQNVRGVTIGDLKKSLIEKIRDKLGIDTSNYDLIFMSESVPIADTTPTSHFIGTNFVGLMLMKKPSTAEVKK